MISINAYHCAHLNKMILNIITGECYAIQNMTKTDRLALLVSGRINVLNDRAFLHHILPGEFLDSPEFESSGLNVGGNGSAGASVEESAFKVTICAAVPSRCIVWQRNTLELLLLKVTFFKRTLNELQIVLTHIICFVFQYTFVGAIQISFVGYPFGHSYDNGDI